MRAVWFNHWGGSQDGASCVPGCSDRAVRGVALRTGRHCNGPLVPSKSHSGDGPPFIIPPSLREVLLVQPP
jgi:hypothetical protein